MKSSRRGGFSLLEVIIAIGILMGSAVVLAELASIGRHHIESAELKSTAQRECQTKLNELLAGAVPLVAVQNSPVSENAGDANPGDGISEDTSQPDPLSNPTEWVYSVEIEPIAGPNQPPGMAQLRVTVAQNLAEHEHPKQFTLTHWIRGVNASSLDGTARQSFGDSASDEPWEPSAETTDTTTDRTTNEAADDSLDPILDLFGPSSDGGLP